MDYPTIVQIETASTCNASCSFCPHSKMNRSNGVRMSDQKFLYLIDQIARWEKPPEFICPFLTNEPFADSRIIWFCAQINYCLPKTKLIFFTNGTLFSEAVLLKLNAVENIEMIHVSWHHGNKEDWEKEMGLNFEAGIASVQRLINWNKWYVRIGRVTDGNKEKDAAFLDFSARVFGPVNTMIGMRYNWKGDIASPFPFEASQDIHCSRHNTLVVLADGRVPLCCMDQNGDYALGDTNKRSLLEIYNSASALAYRSKTKRHSEPCNRCNMNS